MASYRHRLPQLHAGDFLTDGGLETSLVFQEGLELPCFAAFPLITNPEGRATLRRYFAPYLQMARDRRIGFVLDTVTWRANRDWGARLGYPEAALAEVQRKAVDFALELRRDYASMDTPVVINGVVGPRGDGYKADTHMSVPMAERYHSAQIEAFRDTEADMVSAITITYPEEAAGIARAAQANGMPCVISFTVETDGRLPSGHTIGEAVGEVDAATGSFPAYYMINCAHPTHFESVLDVGAPWLDRIRGLRANASARSHAELDEATELDIGDRASLARSYRDLRHRLGRLSIFGGCCGTDHRHIAAICDACMPVSTRPAEGAAVPA
jgi:S-methylmethionine-dependent homocysteine/selenocysteine methylase